MSRRVNLLYCEGNVDGTVGGSYLSLLYLVTNLDRTKFAPRVVFYTTHPLLESFEAAGVKAEVWRAPLRLSFSARFTGGVLGTPIRFLQRLANGVVGFVLPVIRRTWFLKANRIALLHLNNSVLTNHEWMVAALIAGVPCVSHERGINDAYPAFAKYLATRLSGVICISQAVKRRLEREGLGAARLIMIHNGLDPGSMAVERPAPALRASLGIAPNESVVVMVGNIRRWKGQDVVVRAVAKARAEWPSMRCVFVGATSSQDQVFADDLGSLIGELGLAEHVITTGYQRNVADYLNMADVVVHASVLPEPFGRVVLEAMAFRKPVVGAADGAVPEIVVDGETGMLFAPGDVDELAAALVRLCSDATLAADMGRRGYERLMDEFHISRNVTATEALYDEVLS